MDLYGATECFGETISSNIMLLYEKVTLQKLFSKAMKWGNCGSVRRAVTYGPQGWWFSKMTCVVF